MKRLFTVVSLMAITHLAALIGAAGYAYSHGWLEGERVHRALAVLKGEEPREGEAPAEPSSSSAAKSAGERIARNDEVEARAQIELSRREREIQDAWGLLEARQLALLKEQEALEESRKRFAAEIEARKRETNNSGLQREMEIIAGVKPKEAMVLLKQKDDADVVRILLALDERVARKIVSACGKSEEERLWIGRILGKLSERDATQAEALGAGK